MLDNPRIELRLNISYEEMKHEIPEDALLIYTGLVDRFFNFRFGKLKWRSVFLKWNGITFRIIRERPS